MFRRNGINLKGILITTVGLALFYCAYVVLTLFAVPVIPVEYKAPPKLDRQAESSVTSRVARTNDHKLALATPTLASPAGEEIETLAKSVLINGQTSEQFIALFGHPDPALREAATRALALCWSANMGMAEPRAERPEDLTRRYEYMHNFWKDADKSTIMDALLEVVSTSVEAGGNEFSDGDLQVLYLLSGHWGLGAQRAEILAWVANHHPSDDMRLSAMFFLVNRGQEFPRKIGDEVLASRAHDPALRVRVEAWKQRMQRFPFGAFGT